MGGSVDGRDSSVVSTELADLCSRLFRQDGVDADTYRVTQVPNLEPAHFHSQVVTPIVAANHQGSRVVSVWDHRPSQPYSIVLGGTGGFPSWSSTDGSSGQILWPPGTGAVSLGPACDTITPLMDLPHWIRLAASRLPSEEATAPMSVVEDQVGFLAHLEFRLVVIAIPIAADRSESLRNDVVEQIQSVAQRGDLGMSGLLLDVLREELEELTEARSAGLWNVHALVGATKSEAAAQVAAVWAAASRLHMGARVRFSPVGEPASLRTCLERTVRSGDDPLSPAAPFRVGSNTVAALARPPLREIPGVVARTTNPFDVTPQPSSGGIRFGRILDAAGTPIDALDVPLSSIGKHTFIHGATGAGKSQATRHLLTELSKNGIPWIVLEPAKTEYASAMQERLEAVRTELPNASLADVHVVRPGDPEATPVSLNPLQPEPGANYQAHLDVFTDLAVAAFNADSPFPEVLTQAVDVAVRRAGWDPSLSEPTRAVADLYAEDDLPHVPGVKDLVQACHEVISSKGYGKEIESNLRGFVDMRLGTLTTGTKRAAFVSGYPLSLTTALSRNVVLELQELGTDSDRALFMGLFLARLAQAARVRHARDPVDGEVRNVVVIEEAHRLLRNPDDLEGAAARAVESFTDLLAEIRSQGVALIIAEQIPSKIADDVVKNTAIKCMGRTPAADDREFVGAAIGLTEDQSREVVSLPPGSFAVHTDSEDSPLLVKFPYVAEKRAASALDPAPLAGPLPPWFGQAATAGAGNQRDVARAAQLLDDPRWVALIELTILSHLIGWPPPQLDDVGRSLLRGLLGPDSTEIVSALVIGSLTEAGVWSRKRVLGHYTPESLAVVVATFATDLLEGRQPPAPDQRWRSRPHQWAAISKTLKGANPSTPHPDTARWLSWGLPYVIDGPAQTQLEVVRRSVIPRPRDDYRDVVLGEEALVDLVKANGGSPQNALGLLFTFLANSQAERQALIERLVGYLDYQESRS